MRVQREARAACRSDVCRSALKLSESAGMAMMLQSTRIALKLQRITPWMRGFPRQHYATATHSAFSRCAE